MGTFGFYSIEWYDEADITDDIPIDVLEDEEDEDDD